MKNLFSENRLVFMGLKTNPGGAETIKESKERLFDTDKLYTEFTGYLGEGNNTMMDKFGKCRTGGCFQKHINSWFKKYSGRVKATGFKGSLNGKEKKKYEKALWKKLLPDLRNGGKKFAADVQAANTEWTKKVETESGSHSDTLAKKIKKIMAKYAPYEVSGDVGSSLKKKANPKLPEVKKNVGKILVKLAKKFKITYKNLTLPVEGNVSITANLEKVITSNDKVNDRRVEMITTQFSKEAKKKYPKAAA